MSDIPEDAERLRREMIRRSSWRRARVHRYQGTLLDTNELETRLVERAAARRQIAICNFMAANGVANTVKAHRAAIRKLWTPAVAQEFGSPPDPQELVAIRAVMLVRSALDQDAGRSKAPRHSGGGN